jgi:hypothetical protein
MTESKKSWTNEEILQEFLSVIVKNIYKNASEAIDGIREDAADENSMHLRNRLIEIQMGVITDIFDFIDGRTAPVGCPEIKLVNAATCEPLSDDLAWDLSRVEGEIIDIFDPPFQEE